MAFAPLPPELKQRALSIASSYKNGGSVKAPLKKAANVLEQQGRKGDTELVHVTPGELSLLETIGSGTTNPVTGLREFYSVGPGDGAASDAANAAGMDAGRGGRGDDDPMGMADVAAAAEEATRGMSDSEREAAAQAAVDAMDADRGGDRDEQERAITRLFEEEILKATQDNIAAMQGDAEAQARIDKITGAPTAAEALQAARGRPDPAKEQALLAAAALDAAERAARPATPEPQETVTGKAIEEAVSEPIEFFDPRISAGIMSDSPQQFDVEQMRLANDLIARSTPAANQTPVTLDRPLQTDRSGYFRSGEYEVAPPGAISYTPEEIASQQDVDGSMSVSGIGAVAPRSTVQAPTDGIGGALVDADDMVGPITQPDFDEGDLGPVSADVGALASELGIDVNKVNLEGPKFSDFLKPGGILSELGGLFTGEAAVKDAAAGGQVVKNEDGKTVGVVSYDEDGRVNRVTPVGIKESFDPALRDVYRELNDRQTEEREGSDRRDDELTLPEDVEIEEEVAAPERPPTIDIVPFRPEDFYYFQQQPFSYTRQGLPSMMNMRTR